MRSRQFLAWLLVAAVALAGCSRSGGETSGSGSESQPEVLPDFPVSIGEDVRLNEAPQRVVSLSPALTELVYALGYQSQLVGVSNFCDIPDEAASLPRCGSSQGINFAELEKLEPQLVLISAPLVENELLRLQQRNIQVLQLGRAGDLNGLQANYTDLGRALQGETTGRAAGAAVFEELGNVLEAGAQQARDTINAGKAKQSVIMLRMTDFIMATGDSFEQKLLDKLLLENLAAPYGNWAYPADKVAELKPDFIIADKSITIPMLEKNAVYKGTQAVLKDRVVNIDFSAFERQSPRMATEIEKIINFAYAE